MFQLWSEGTERCTEALQKLTKKFDIVVNIQGDEPLIDPEIIDGVVMALQVTYFASHVTSPLLVIFYFSVLFSTQLFCQLEYHTCDNQAV